MNNNYIRDSLTESLNCIQDYINDEKNLQVLEAAIGMLVETAKKKKTIFSCGNGGSMSDSIHFIEELTGRFRGDRPAIRALSMSDIGHVTCVSNDYGYDFIFSRFLEAHGTKDDLLVGITTSGNSPNVLKAVERAKELGMKTIALTGKDGGAIKDMVDLPIIVPHTLTDKVQEVHIKIIHLFIEGIERNLYPDNYN